MATQEGVLCGISAAVANTAAPMVNNLLQLYNCRLSTDNTIRKDAEARLTQLQNEDPNLCAVATMIIIRQNPSEDVRQQGALQLKIVLRESAMADLAEETEATAATGGKPTFWKMLSEDTKKLIKAELIASLESDEPSKTVRNAVCDTTTQLASSLLNDTSEWPELQPKIFSLLSSTSSLCQASGLQVLSNLVSDADDVVKQNITSIRDVVNQLMLSEAGEVRYECVNLISSIVGSTKRPVWKNLQSAVPSVLHALSLSLQGPSDDEGTKLLVSLIDIAEYDAGFFSLHLPAVTATLVTVARNTQFTDRLRQLALELLLTMVEGKPKMCKKADGFVDELLRLLMEFMVTLEEDAEWLENDTADNEEDDDDDEDATNYDVAEGGLDRLAASAGGDVVLPKLFVIVGQYLQQPQWTMKHAAMMAVSQTVEHIPEEEVERYLEHIVPICLQQLKDPHPRVRYAACQAVGQAATDTQPLIQEQYYSSIMPALIAALDDEVLRLQSHSARALSNFCEDMKADDLAAFVDPLVQKLLRRVAIGTPRPVLSACVTTLAVVAAAADTLFVKYYPSVVPAMKEIVRVCGDKTERTCREKALECITLVALAIGPKEFASDTAECMQAIIQLWTADADLQESNQEGESGGEGPTETLNESLCRMCRVLEAEFVQYLPHIMPRVVKILEQKPHQLTLEQLAGNPREVCLVGLVDGKTIGMKTHITLEMEQITALLYTFVSTLGEHFKDWVGQTIQTCLPLLEFQYCEKIIQNALNILAEALKVARQLADAETVEAQRSTGLQLISSWMRQAVERGFEAITDDQLLVDSTLEVPKSVATILKNSGPGTLSADQVSGVSKKTLQLLDGCCTRNEDIVEGKNEEHDEDDEDDIEGEQRYELELAGSLVEILNAVIEHHQDLFTQVAAPLAIEFVRSRLAVATKLPHAAHGGGIPLVLAIYVICELVALGDKGVNVWGQFIPTLVQSLSSSDPLARQPAAHALKLVAKKCTVISTETVAACARALIAAVKNANMKQTLEEQEQGALDNAVGCIGALIFHQAEHLSAAGDPSISPANLFNAWLSNLPLKVDDQEGQIVHGELVQLVLNNNETVMGPEMANLPHLFKIFAQIYSTSFSTEGIDKQLIRIVQSTGDAPLEAIHMQLPKDQKRKLEKLLVEARKTAAGGV